MSLVFVSTARVINHGPAILLSGLVRPSVFPLVSDIRVGKVRSFDRDLVSVCMCDVRGRSKSLALIDHPSVIVTSL